MTPSNRNNLKEGDRLPLFETDNLNGGRSEDSEHYSVHSPFQATIVGVFKDAYEIEVSDVPHHLFFHRNEQKK